MITINQEDFYNQLIILYPIRYRSEIREIIPKNGMIYGEGVDTKNEKNRITTYSFNPPLKRKEGSELIRKLQNLSPHVELILRKIEY